MDNGKANLIYRDRAFVEKKYASKNKKNFRKKIDPLNGIDNNRYFYAFIFGCLIGTIYEDILIYFLKDMWQLHSGVLWLPLNPLYGFGCLMFVWVLSHLDKWYHKLTYGAILGGAVEYFASLFQEIFTNSISWDYAGKPTNIDGRTTVIFAMGWGMLGYAIYTFIFPILRKFLKNIPYRIGARYTKCFKITIVLVMIISYVALIRASLSLQGQEPLTIIGKWLDILLPAKYVKLFFVNLKYK